MAKDDHIMIEEAFAQKRMTRGTFLRLAQYVAPYRQTFFLNLLFTLLATVSQLLGPPADGAREVHRGSRPYNLRDSFFARSSTCFWRAPRPRLVCAPR